MYIKTNNDNIYNVKWCHSTGVQLGFSVICDDMMEVINVFSQDIEWVEYHRDNTQAGTTVYSGYSKLTGINYDGAGAYIVMMEKSA